MNILIDYQNNKVQIIKLNYFPPRNYIVIQQKWGLELFQSSAIANLTYGYK